MSGETARQESGWTTDTLKEYLEARFVEADKRYQMGKGMYEAYRAGKFTFDQITGKHVDDIYGEMKVAKPLKDLIPQ